MATYSKTNVSSTSIKIKLTAGIADIIWSNFLKVNSTKKQQAKKKAQDKWGVTPNDWYIYRSSAMKQYAPIYKFFYNSANTHKLSPEFIHAVVMGEGLHLLLEELRSSKTKYDSTYSINAYSYLGADEIGTSIDDLIKNGYIDVKHKKNITPNPVVNELGEPKVSAIIAGFETGIEVVAAELHSRKDWILAYIKKKSLKVKTSDSDTVDYLTYATYNNMSVGMDAAKNIDHYMRKYSGTERTDQQNVRFNTLKRLAASDWYKEAKVYNV